MSNPVMSHLQHSYMLFRYRVLITCTNGEGLKGSKNMAMQQSAYAEGTHLGVRVE